MRQDQHQHKVDYRRVLNITPRGRIVVPKGHSSTTATRLSPKTVVIHHSPVKSKSVQSKSALVRFEDLVLSTPVDRKVAPVAKPVVTVAAKKMPKAPVSQTDAASTFSPFEPLPIDSKDTVRRPAKDKSSRSNRDKVKSSYRKLTTAVKKGTHNSRARLKQTHAKLNKKRNESRAKRLAHQRTRLENAVKLAQLDTAPAENQLATAERVLASAATMDSAEPANVANLSDNATAMAITAALPQSNFVAKVASMPKVTFTFKINTTRLLAVLRAVAIILILAVSGYLAWDTWMTNRTVENTFSNPASAMSIDGTNPATADPTSISDQQWAAHTVPADHPRYLYIPSINVRARVMSVGVTSKGNIDTPKNLNDTAWYDGSAKPNRDGQVFIDGHTSFSNNLAAAFNALPKLQKGARITIETGDGKKVNYTVVATETVTSDNVNMNKALNTPDGAKKGLTLMTCTGKFNYRTQNSSQRFIVYAVQE